MVATSPVVADKGEESRRGHEAVARSSARATNSSVHASASIALGTFRASLRSMTNCLAV